jgi:hypothetical protein
MRLKPQYGFATALQALALLLAKWQGLGGIRTDEAKYLLSIPYPHPPLARAVLSATEALPFQETLWRVVLATLLVQAVWLVWDMTRRFHLEDRVMVCATWLLSAAVLVQSGSIMMTPLTALQALLFLWLRTRRDLVRAAPGWVSLLWMATLFTAYQGLLLLPLAWGTLRHGGHSRAKSAVLTLVPVVALVLYSLSNPLALATMLIHRDEATRITVTSRLLGLAKLWLIGGSGVGSIVGTWGVLRSRDRALQLTFVIFCAYFYFSITQPYNAVLFAPFLVEGMRKIFADQVHPHAFPLLSCLIGASAVIVWFSKPSTKMEPARAVMQAIRMESQTGPVLINGPFGHDWQYESVVGIRTYGPQLVESAQAVVCLEKCPSFATSGWKRLQNVPAEAWMKK